MRRISVFPFLLLAGSAIPASSAASGQAVVFRAPPSSQACPVDGAASRKTTGNVEVTSGNGSGASGVHIVLNPAADINAKAPAKIIAASVTVHALSAKDRFVPAASGAAADIAKDFHLTSSARNDSSIGADLWMDRGATVLWVDVTEVRYADGSSWHAGGGTSCRIVPESLVLVAGAR